MPGCGVSTPAQQPVVAALLMCGTTICFTIVDSILKALVVEHGVPMLVTARLGMQMVLMLALTPWLGRRILRLQLPAIQFGRALAMIAGSALVSISLRYLPITQTYAIGFSAPLIATLVAVAILGERLNWRQAVCILAGFAGVVVALDPGAPDFSPVLLFPLALAAANASLHVLTRIGRAEDPLAATMWSATFAFAIAACGLPWTYRPLPLTAWALLVVGGVSVTIGQLMMVEAFRRAPTAIVSPMVYTQFVWSAISGIVVFGETPGAGVVIGALAVALSGVALIRWATPKTPPA
jgi:drug/metabolite transporter (DMT)-like permease